LNGKKGGGGETIENNRDARNVTAFVKFDNYHAEKTGPLREALKLTDFMG
jgi:hypothetical protein